MYIGVCYILRSAVTTISLHPVTFVVATQTRFGFGGWFDREREDYITLSIRNKKRGFQKTIQRFMSSSASMRWIVLCLFFLPWFSLARPLVRNIRSTHGTICLLFFPHVCQKKRDFDFLDTATHFGFGLKLNLFLLFVVVFFPYLN